MNAEVLAALEGCELNLEGLAEKTGRSKSAVKNALWRLRSEGQVVLVQRFGDLRNIHYRRVK